ncbi:MAG: porin family protein [Cyclobacteriaceae bacterium]|nr:porin family protein [Cyclobacteriaceae bacterium]
MKSVFTILLIAFTSVSFGQTNGKWSVGVGYTPSVQRGSTFGVYINRHFGEKWQVGLIPFGWFYGYDNPRFTSLKSNSLGLNLSARYSPFQSKILKPYLYSFAGYGYSTFKYSNPTYLIDVLTMDYVNLSLGIGTEIAISKGRSLDANLGYLRLAFFDRGYDSSPVFSIGVLKRFGKTE